MVADAAADYSIIVVEVVAYSESIQPAAPVTAVARPSVKNRLWNVAPKLLQAVAA